MCAVLEALNVYVDHHGAGSCARDRDERATSPLTMPTLDHRASEGTWSSRYEEKRRWKNQKTPTLRMVADALFRNTECHDGWRMSFRRGNTMATIVTWPTSTPRLNEQE